MAHVLGIDKDTGARVCHGRWTFRAEDRAGLIPEGAWVMPKEELYLTDGRAEVLMASMPGMKKGNTGTEDSASDGTGKLPTICVNSFGKGKGIYLASFQVTPENTRMLYQLIRYAGGEGVNGVYMTDNLYTECAYYPESGKLVIINNSDREQTATIPTEQGSETVTIAAYDTVFVELA